MKSILVVDDNKTNLTFERDVLEKMYRVTAVSSGRDALNYLENGLCDLILLDINMPEMDGFETMRRIREKEELSRIPIIFLTGDSDPETEMRCLETGAMDFIVKPFVPEVMLMRIGRILELEDMRRHLTDRLERKIREVSDFKARSRQDALTELWNRVYTEETVDRIIEEGGSGFLFMIDMDNFKAINDHYGHIEGDSILKMFADTMRKFSAKDDVLCRIGGDEFIMFIRGEKSKDEIGDIAAGIISDLCAKLGEKQYETHSSVSIGIAQAPEDAADFNALYNAADKALYHVKQNGKNSYHFYSEQKADEDARGSTLVDLQYLREIMSRADSGKGAYQIDLDSFHHVYNFIRRFVERSGRNVQTLLFTFYAQDGVEQSDVDEAIETLELAIQTSLRRVDVSTRYSSRQVIVILMETSVEDSDMVAQRILDCFKQIYVGAGVSISYDVAKMEREHPIFH